MELFSTKVKPLVASYSSIREERIPHERLTIHPTSASEATENTTTKIAQYQY